MWTDIALRARYERYTGCSREGYAKDPLPKCRALTNSEHHEVEALRKRLDTLEGILSTNAQTTNENQQLIVDQIRQLKTKQ
jgi:hypothetical protein